MGAGNVCAQDSREHEYQEVKFKEVGCYKYQLKAETKQHFSMDIIPQQFITEQLTNLLEELAFNRIMFKDGHLKLENFALKTEKDQKIICRWARVQKLIKGEIKICSDPNPETILVKDQVMQYFGVFLIFLAKNPLLIEKIILTKHNSFGIHLIKSYKAARGNIIIDDLILCNDKLFPLFSQPEKNSIWPMILEKAWIKVNNLNLVNIQNLSPQIPIQQFLSIPNKTYFIQKWKQNPKLYDSFKKFLNDKECKNYFYCLRSKKFDPENDQIIGIRDRVYFAVLTHFKLDNKIFFVLRNPLGSFNYRGRWTYITEQMKKKLKQQGMLDLKPGNFIIDQDQVLEYFETIQIIFYKEGYIPNLRKFNYKPNEQFFFSFRIKNSLPIGITIIQQIESQRAPFMIDLIDINSYEAISYGQNLAYLAQKNTNVFQNVLKNLKPGQYLLRLKSKQQTNLKSKSAIRSTYVNQSQKLESDIKEQETYRSQFNKFLRKSGERQFEKNNNKIIKKNSFFYLIKWFTEQTEDSDITNRAVIYIQNKKNKVIQLQFDFYQIKNLAWVSHEQAKGQQISNFLITLKQNIQMIVLEKIKLNQQTSIGNHSIKAD